MQIGTPVITTPTSDLKGYVVNGKNGFIASECTYDAFLYVCKMAMETSVTERRNMHQKSELLDETRWTDIIGSFIGNLNA